MKRLLRRFPIIIPVGLLVLSVFFSHSCANTTQSPTGGDKDTIPPYIVGLAPMTGATNMPVHGTKIYIRFNEYVTIKNSKNILLSPPQKKAPKSKVKGKGVMVWFEEDLEPNTTYTLEFTDAIADNNEGNMFPGFTYVFSTGASIDSMMVTGIVQDSKTLLPVKGATVMLYTDLADSAVFLHRPAAVTRTDDWGFFCARNLKDTAYHVYAIRDENTDNLYESETETIGFVDTVVTPHIKMNDSIPELWSYDMTDTLHCMARKTELELNLFREKPSKQLIVNTVRTAERDGYITFMAPKAHIDSLWIRGYKPNEVITEFNIERDSLLLWVNSLKTAPDTLHLFVNYRKTDSLGHLVPFLEHVKLYDENSPKNKRKSRRDIKHEDTICVYKLTGEPEKFEQYGFEIEFSEPIIYEKFDSLQFTSINPKQKESKASYKVIPDTLNLRKFTIMPKDKLLKGWEYKLKVPARSFRDIAGHWCDSSEVKVSIPDDDKLSTLNLVATDVHTKYIIDLMTERRDQTVRSFIIDNDCTVTFPYLKAGKYCIRITEDKNKNGIVDTGDILTHRQSEKVKYFKVGGNIMLDIMESAEVEQNVDMGKLFSK